ncbi:MAG: 50S ribosomal protein L11 methyltransferase [Fimbriimonadales bacterium]|nr:50S ribosomal protein L11 methyltransferase [Fimbriimonadales bacterium]
MNWILIKAKQTPAPADWSPIINTFRDYGIENTLEEANCITGCYVDVDGVRTQIESLRTALLALGVDDVIDEPFVEVDWENEWKKFFKPRRVGSHFVVRPTWESFDALPSDKVIVLDPGQAFGTGDHPTTRMCLEYLEMQVASSNSVLDLGCGSGILAVGAKMVGAGETLAIDIDPIAVEVAKENITRNNVEVKTAVGDVLELQLESRWDIVVSNIISATLINLAPDAAYALKSGGKWIVSGIITQNWSDVKKAAEKSGFTYIEHREEDGWNAGVFEK